MKAVVVPLVQPVHDGPLDLVTRAPGARVDQLGLV